MHDMLLPPKQFKSQAGSPPPRHTASAVRLNTTHPPTTATHHFGQVAVYARSPLRPQAKLTVSAPGDQYEQEADRVAAAVVSGPLQPEQQISRGIQPKLYRKIAMPEDLVDSILPPVAMGEAETADSEEIQRSATAPAGTVTPQIEQSIQRSIGQGGAHLPAATRDFMGQRFGWDFSSVQVHHDREADSLARGLNAQAFTIGQDIFFADAQYQPQSQAGQRLLAHELTHVVQQSDGRIARQIQRATRCSSYNGYDSSADLNTYNCAGLALRTYLFTSPPSAVIDSIAANFIAPHTPGGQDCGPEQVKFWLWEYDMHAEDDLGTRLSPTGKDFHIVGGRYDALGMEPTDVYTKNGRRRVYGPGTGGSFRPATRERALSNDPSETPVTSPQGRPVFKVRNNMSEALTCADCHP